MPGRFAHGDDVKISAGGDATQRPPLTSRSAPVTYDDSPPAGVPSHRHAAPGDAIPSALLLLAMVIIAWASSAPSSSRALPPLLAGTAAEATGHPVDGIECEVKERLLSTSMHT
jgi:hypothetical protein